jgi:hypothetical protein
MLPTLLFIRIFSATTLPQAGIACTVTPAGSLFGLLKPWYYYIASGRWDTNGNCIPSIDLINHANQVWLIGLALFDDLLAIAGFAAVAMVIFGGFRFITSGGSSEQAKAARGTIINALIGLVIVSVATVLVSFLAGYLSQ